MANTVRRPRDCEVCGAGYRPTYYEQRTCGRSCGSILSGRNAVRSIRFTAVAWRECADCSSSYTLRGGRRCGCDAPRSRVFVTECKTCCRWFCSPYTVSTCSAECAAAKRLADRRVAKDKRRALQRDAFVANVYRAQVFKRDGWRCHLCGKPVNRKATVPHPHAATLDHVVPLAAGGTHEPSNCRTAHYLCNSRKGARGGGEQLLLLP